MTDFKYKKVLVTGGAGFIGSNLIEKLVSLGVETVSIDDLSAGKKRNLEHLKKIPFCFLQETLLGRFRR